MCHIPRPFTDMLTTEQRIGECLPISLRLQTLPWWFNEDQKVTSWHFIADLLMATWNGTQLAPDLYWFDEGCRKSYFLRIHFDTYCSHFFISCFYFDYSCEVGAALQEQSLMILFSDMYCFKLCQRTSSQVVASFPSAWRHLTYALWQKGVLSIILTNVKQIAAIQLTEDNSFLPHRNISLNFTQATLLILSIYQTLPFIVEVFVSS